MVNLTPEPSDLGRDDITRAPYLVVATVWLLPWCSLPWRIYGNNVHSWIKLWDINHLLIGHSITFRWKFHCIVAIDTGSLLALWQCPDCTNNQMHSSTNNRASDSDQALGLTKMDTQQGTQASAKQCRCHRQLTKSPTAVARRHQDHRPSPLIAAWEVLVVA